MEITLDLRGAAAMAESNAQLREKIAQLEEENERLRAGQVPAPNTQPVDTEPSFGMSEGERQEIEMTGTATSPWTGDKRTESDLPQGVQVDPAARQQERTRPARPDTVIGDQNRDQQPDQGAGV